MTTSTKARSASSKTSNGTGSTEVPPTGAEFYQQAQQFAEGADDPTITMPPVDEQDEAPSNRHDRRRQERQAAADEREQQRRDIEDEAREALAIARDVLSQAQAEYDMAHSRAKTLREQLDESSPVKGFWDVFGFLRTHAGFGRGHEYGDHMADETRRNIAETELVLAQYEEEKALLNLSRAAQAHRVAKHMSAKFRFRYRNEPGQGYYRAVSRINMWEKVKAPFRWLGNTVLMVLGTVASAVITVLSVVGVVALGALTLVASVSGLFSWGLGKARRDPAFA